jgi:drug/metabolite transporter (DMT)-like permease
VSQIPQATNGPGGGVLTANLFCMGSMIAWAIGFPAAEFLLLTWDPMALIVARLMLAVGLMIPVWILADGPAALLTARWGRGTFVGGFGFGIGAYLMLLGQALADPVTVAIVASTMPAVAAVFEVLFDGRRLRRGFVVGVMLVLIGGLVATGANPLQGNVGLGAGLALISVISFTWGSRAAVRDFPDLSPIGQTTITLAGALFISVAAYAVVGILGLPGIRSAPLDATGWTALAIYAVAAMALSQLLWLLGVGRLGVALAAFHINSAMFYVMIIMVTLGAAWNWIQVLGAAIVALGVFVAQMWRKRLSPAPPRR